jgi:hypothetical protein
MQGSGAASSGGRVDARHYPSSSESASLSARVPRVRGAARGSLSDAAAVRRISGDGRLSLRVTTSSRQRDDRMTSQYRTHAEIAGALAVASLGGATPAGADPNPTRRNVCRQTSTTPGCATRRTSRRSLRPVTTSAGSTSRRAGTGSSGTTRRSVPGACSGSCSPSPAVPGRSLSAIVPLKCWR